MDSITPNPAKALLRDEITARLAALTTEEKQRQSEIVYNKVINHPWYQNTKRVAIYMSTDLEVDTAAIIAHIKARGASAFVPQYSGGVMRMLKLEQDDENNMPLTRRGIAQHKKGQVRENALETGGIDLVIAPGVAFTKSGTRCGHGGGYCDKIIARVRKDLETVPKVVALAFKCQVQDYVPMDAHDQRVDDVIFEDD